MALGDVVTFQQFYLDLGLGVHNLLSNQLKVGIITDATTPVVGLADPHFGGTGGTTNLATNEVAAGGGYTAGGVVCGSVTFALAAGVAKLSFTNPAWTKAAGSPTDCYFLALYNNTHTKKPVICTVDLAGPVSLVAKDITWEVSANGAVRIKLD